MKDCPECGGKLYWRICEGLICETCGLILKNPVFLEREPLYW